MAEALAAVGQVFSKERTTLFLLFAYYCCRGTEVNFLYLNEWTQFVEDLGISSNKSKVASAPTCTTHLAAQPT